MTSKPTYTAPSPGQPLSGQGVLRISRLKIAKSKLRICTWNVKSLYASGKLDNLAKEIQRLNIQIAGISEVRWPGSGTCHHEKGTLYYSGKDENDRHHRNGVGIFVTSKYTEYVKNFVPINDRILLLQLNSQPVDINIIQVYAPTADRKYDAEVESFYNQLNDTLRNLKKSNEVTIIMGDFNAKIGKGRRGELVGDFGLGDSNNRGDRLFEFCQDHNMVITNTWFKLHDRRLYTWKSPGDMTRNQIDYILIHKRFRNCVKKATTYPGADMGSDHNPVTATVEVKLKKLSKPKNKKVDVINIDTEQVKADLNTYLKQVNTNNTVDNLWQSLRTRMLKLVDQNKTNKELHKKQKWMTTEILNLMEERRLLKNNPTEYRMKQKEIKRKIREAKEKWMLDRCKEMEELQNKHDYFSMYKKVKEVAGIYGKRNPHVLTDSSGRLILDENEILKTWSAYVIELFNDNNRPENPPGQQIIEGPDILNVEVEHAIKTAKKGKSPGPDDIPVELLKMIEDENISIITKLFNAIYNTGEIPKDWLKSVFITLPKKQRAKKCGDFRLISLMSHTLKVFLRIIHGRIREKCEADLDDTQFGFRNSFGTREALFSLNVLLQKCRDQRKDVFVCFIDYEKAFDRVKHEKLLHILRSSGVDGKDVRIIENLYWKQNAVVRTNGKMTEECKIQRGVRQGCILSPLLFNLYSDKIFKTALHDLQLGIKINGKIINTIRYADDTVILCDSLQGLQQLSDAVNAAGHEFGLSINVAKTKFMVFSRDSYLNAMLTINDDNIERVNHFKYLGSYITEQLDPDMEIKSRIETARTTFIKLKALLCNDNINLALRHRLVKCYIWSVLLYGAETWTLKASAINKLEAFEMWLHRRMLRIPWTALQTNQAVLERANATREMLKQIKIKKITYLGHVIRGDKYHVLQLIMKGKIEGRRGVGRRQASWLRNIREWTGIQSAEQLFRLAENKEEFAIVIANVGGT